MFAVGQEVRIGNGPVMVCEVVECDDSTVTVRFWDPWQQQYRVESVPTEGVRS